MKAACSDENILKILYGELLYLKIPGSSKSLIRCVFIKVILKPEVTVIAVKNTSSTNKRKKKETEKNTDLIDKELINKQFQEYKKE